MLLKSLRLENIRSYTSQTILFPKGKILLAGDIGSGKSTILHSIEFALFGLGELDSAGLLRHGTASGSVELTFELNSQTVLIYRQLKRNKNTISQDTTWIMRNNEKQALMPTELKAHIIKLLGYPEEFLTKSKNPIYRYTVYTPQEDMKAILFAKPDERLGILRQLFGIDKYKRIRENAAVYARYLREQARELQGIIIDLESKKKLLEQNKQELASVEKTSSEKLQILDAAKIKSEQIKNHWSEAEKKFAAMQVQKQEHSRIDAEIRYKKDFIEKHEQERDRTTTAITILNQELGQDVFPERQELAMQSKEKEAVIKTIDARIKEASTILTRARTIIEHEEHTVQNITSLNTCPVCKQAVAQEHKQLLVQEGAQKTILLKQEIQPLQQTLIIQEQELELARQELQKLKTQEQHALLFEFKHQQLKEKQEHLSHMIAELSNTKNSITALEQQSALLTNNILLNGPAEETCKNFKKEYDLAIHQERLAEVEYTVQQQLLLHIVQTIDLLAEDVAKKETANTKLIQLQRIQNWIADFFCPLMETMEKNVFTAVWHDFNTLFQQWFSILIQDSMLTAQLDTTFTPLLQQNGYDTSIDYLSGGERTAAALAYRLALNKIINDLLHAVQTKDLLILDEPTDGFSDEQLDRVRDVLDQLNLGQIILVSHEQKVEGFVQHVVRVQKEGGESRVIV